MQATLSVALKQIIRASRIAPLIFALAQTAGAQDNSNATHPLDPLSKAEIAATVEILKAAGKTNAASRFPLIALREPPKEEVLAGSLTRREAFAVAYERAGNKTFEAVVDLRNKSVLSWKEVAGVQPTMLVEDYFIMQSVVRSDPGWQEAMKKRGITDLQNIQLDPWSAGQYGFAEEQGSRVFRAVAYYRGSAKNGYARPIEGVVAYVDVNAKKILKLVDSGVVPLAKASNDYDMKSVGKLRAPTKPLQIIQPEGASFTLAGGEVRWENWRFRFGMHPREGLVLYAVGYEDQARVRSVVYRASLSEMVVPYGDPGPAWFFRNAFDEGEYAIGRFANSLEPMTDAPANAMFFPAVFPGDNGMPIEVPRAVALFERDGGLLWKHFEFDRNHNESRRARQLVLSWIATVGNYEYGFNWIFSQDGALEMEVLMTGIMQPKGVKAATANGHEHGDGSYGHLVAENVEAVHHQHFFNFRLDMDIESAAGNSVVEMNTEALPPGPKNPYLNGFVMKETLLPREQQAQRQLNLASGRKWKVINPSVINSLGRPVGYILVPGENAVPYAAPGSSVRKRAGFINSHLWVTRYDPSEIHAAGYYVSQSKGGDGLPRWTAANRSIAAEDIVLWYTMGVTHIGRAEEWPVMPVHRTGFRLVPGGFFARNPALDVPKP